jgi:predicted amidohydrolase YtcJ
VGYGYDGTTLFEARELSRDDLDPHFPDNPVMLLHVSNHGCVMNSKAFEWAKIDASTKTPAGGIILRKNRSNEPDGLIMEQAFAPVFANWPKPTEEQMLETLDAAQQIYASVGVTTCQESGTHAADLKFLKKGAEQGRFYLDIVSLPFVMEVPLLIKEYFPSFIGGKLELPDTAKESFGTYKSRLKIAGIKIPLDGSPQGKTAFWSKPLLTPGPGGEKDWRGEPLFPPELVNKVVAEFYKKDIPVFTHCNGDAAIDMMIDAVRAAGGKAGQDRRTVIVRSQFMRPDQLDVYVELGLTPSFFTVHCFF